MSDYLKCVHCGWQTRKWSAGKRGKPVSGWLRLQHHLEDKHDILADLISDAPRENEEQC